MSAATDAADASLDINDVVISNVTSDEPEDQTGTGDGNTQNDIAIANDCRSVMLRREGATEGDGRVC